MAQTLAARLARDLDRLQRAAGLTDDALAGRLRLTPRELRRLKRRQHMTVELLERAARALGAAVEVRLTPHDSPRPRVVTAAHGAQAGRLGAVERRLRAALEREDPVGRYDAGAVVLAVRRAPDVYGDNAVPVLAAAVGEPAASIYRFARVAECWTRDQVRKLLALGVTWSHLVALSHLDGSKPRQAWLARIVRTNMTVRDLDRHLSR